MVELAGELGCTQIFMLRSCVVYLILTEFQLLRLELKIDTIRFNTFAERMWTVPITTATEKKDIICW